ncbi:MAG TPA: helix-hairpin-helix domain-containing protein [Gemmataceae bacterium]|nr:helix-hairpin-helix domain-containing protein [Gemmataceae bacterium]
MEAAPPSVGVATVSPTPPPGWPQAARWMSPPGDLSIRLSSDPTPTWSRPAQGMAALLLLLAVALLTWHTYAAQRGSCRPAVLESDTRDLPAIDLNQADRAQLLQLPGVGDNLAARIEVYRTEHRGFRDVEELRQVGGVGPVLLEKLRPFVYVEPREKDEEDDARRTPIRPFMAEPKKDTPPLLVGKKKFGLAQPLDINQATREDLQRLPGIGPKLSQRIIDTREKKAFKSVDDLRRVPGIGPKTLQRLRPHVKVALN